MKNKWRHFIDNFKPGFGCLIPKNEGLNILGILFNSHIFEHRVVSDEIESITCIMRDDSANLEWFSMPKGEFKQLIINDLDQIFGIEKEPLDVIVSKWENGIPLYSPTLYRSWFEMDEILKKQFPHRNLFGNYTGEISIRAMAQSLYKISQKLK